MARKGSAKVRTGCLTCKIRKVKCDEGKPHCRRCLSTGRRCDGYVQTAASSDLTWHRPRHLFPGIDDVNEKRALQFFCQAAGPSLSGPMDPYFWTHLVLQFSHFEPAVRHSVVAISSLYEHIQTRPKKSAHQLVDNKFALSHYNSAIKELKSMNNEPLVLLVCILFICIEFLQDNQGAAIQHCKHGVHILKKAEVAFPWTKEYLSPIFRRLTLFPFFFALDCASFPRLINLEDQVPYSFCSFEEAQNFLDGILLRTISLVRQGDSYRLGELRHCPVDPELLADQDNIRALLSDWNKRFLDLRSRSLVPAKQELLCIIILRYEVARIWVETSFDDDETAYDEYMGRFHSMVSMAVKLHYSRALIADNLRSTRKFIFEMGFVPLLYYIVMKCRCLDTRIEALSLMKKLGVAKENLWEVSTMHAVGRRIVEIEHAVLLDDNEKLLTTPVWPGLPPDEMRVRDSTTRPAPSIQIDTQDHEVRGRMAGFFRRTVNGDIYLQTDFVAETA
ncbi:hypothetical protein F5Y11DRAFT_359696 [Daldinia sp. FL1419]|nr:hypothetical protein F5Y11DRAFT_359696 [Daldinia sp. FL1419]